MILGLLEEETQTPVTLFHGVRARQDLYDNDLFESLASQHANFTYVPVLSQQNEGDGWADDAGFLHVAAQRHYNSNF